MSTGENELERTDQYYVQACLEWNRALKILFWACLIYLLSRARVMWYFYTCLFHFFLSRSSSSSSSSSSRAFNFIEQKFMFKLVWYIYQGKRLNQTHVLIWGEGGHLAHWTFWVSIGPLNFSICLNQALD